MNRRRLAAAAAMAAMPLTVLSTQEAAASPQPTVNISPPSGAGDEDTMTVTGLSDCNIMYATLDYFRYDGEEDLATAKDEHAKPTNGGRYEYRIRLRVPADADPSAEANVIVDSFCGPPSEFPAADPIHYDLGLARPDLTVRPLRVAPGDTVTVALRRCYGPVEAADVKARLPGMPLRVVRVPVRANAGASSVSVPRTTRSGSASVELPAGTCPGSSRAATTFAIASLSPPAGPSPARPTSSASTPPQAVVPVPVPTALKSPAPDPAHLPAAPTPTAVAFASPSAVAAPTGGSNGTAWRAPAVAGALLLLAAGAAVWSRRRA